RKPERAWATRAQRGGALQVEAAARVRPRERGRARPGRARPLLRRGGRLRGGAGPRAGGVRGAARADPRGRARVSLPPGATDTRRVGGGDINEAYRVTLADGREAFVKTRNGAHPGEYRAEAEGLAWLREPG